MNSNSKPTSWRDGSPLGVCRLSNGIAPGTHGTYRGHGSPTLTPISSKAAGPLALVVP